MARKRDEYESDEDGEQDEYQLQEGEEDPFAESGEDEMEIDEDGKIIFQWTFIGISLNNLMR